MIFGQSGFRKSSSVSKQRRLAIPVRSYLADSWPARGDNKERRGNHVQSSLTCARKSKSIQIFHKQQNIVVAKVHFILHQRNTSGQRKSWSTQERADLLGGYGGTETGKS